MILRAALGVALTVAAAAPTPLFRLSDPRLAEVSGIAAGIASPGVLYVQNDSGDPARFFALDRTSGRLLATYTVPGATNVDWEDIAVARDRRGVPSVWLADIGDNDGNRPEVRIYRVDEPQVRPGVHRTGPPDVWRLRYPGGATDAEALAVAPGGAAYVFTKSLLGATSVYAVPRAPDPDRAQSLRRIGSIDFGFTGTPGGPNPIGQLTATGAALSADGSLLAVRTYTDAYVWRVRGGDVAAALRKAPARVALPAQPQGEGIAISRGRLLIDSEGVDSAVYSVPVPAMGPQLPTPSRPAKSSAAKPAASSSASDAPDVAVVGAVAAAIAVVFVAGGLGLVRRAKRRR